MEIREYELTWSEINNTNPNDVTLEYIGMKTLLSREPCWQSDPGKGMSRQEVYSYYPELNNYLIDGIQIKRRNSDGKTR